MAQRKLLMLGQHLRTDAVPTPKEIDAMKAMAASLDTPIGDVLGEIAGLHLLRRVRGPRD